MAATLPLDMYYSIIEHVDDTETLLSLALSCSNWRHLAQSQLFREVKAMSVVQERRFIFAINTSLQALGPLVRVFHMIPKSHIRSWLWDDSDEDDEHYQDQLSAPLQAMYNLRELYMERVWPSAVLKNHAFRLHTFSCHMEIPTHDCFYLLWTFLPRQNSIRRLLLVAPHTWNFDTTAPDNLCPDLDLLAISDGHGPLTSMLLAKSTRLTRLLWMADKGAPNLTTRQFNNLRGLRINIDRNMNMSFVSHLISLELLEVHFQQRDALFVVSSLAFLPKIPHLKALIVEFGSEYDVGDWRYETWIPRLSIIYLRIFDICPQLQYIDSRQVSDGIFYRLERPALGATEDRAAYRLDISPFAPPEWQR